MSNCEQTVPFADGYSEQNSPKFGLKWPVWEQSFPFTDTNAEQNSPKLSIWEQRDPFADRNTEQSNPNLSIWEQIYSIYREELRTKQSFMTNLGTMRSIRRQEPGTKKS